MKKILKIILIAIIVLIAVIIAGGYSMFSAQLKAANTIEKIGGSFYSMEYDGDYGFSEYLSRGGASSDEEMADYITEFLSHGFYKTDIQSNGFGCSTVAVKSQDGGALFGRNFDWMDCTKMTVTTRPDDGYASVSTCDLDFLGFGNGWLPEEMKNKIMALAAVYVPLDGMNEKGLCVADLVIDDGTTTNQQSDKPDITTTSAIRLLLDRAANVDEAIELLNKYDMHSSAGMQHHLSVMDSTGRSVVVEYIDNVMYVTDADVVTNFYLTEGDNYGIGSENSHLRYETLKKLLSDSNFVMTNEQVMETLQAVCQYGPKIDDYTQWSVVFDTENQTAQYKLPGDISVIRSLIE